MVYTIYSTDLYQGLIIPTIYWPDLYQGAIIPAIYSTDLYQGLIIPPHARRPARCFLMLLRTVPPAAALLSHRMDSLTIRIKSTPAQNCRLNILISNSKQ